VRQFSPLAAKPTTPATATCFTAVPSLLPSLKPSMETQHKQNTHMRDSFVYDDVYVGGLGSLAVLFDGVVLKKKHPQTSVAV